MSAFDPNPYAGGYGGRVRTRDPQASWDVAPIAAVELTALKRAILALLQERPRTDSALIIGYAAAGHPFRTPQRIRTARAELVREARVRDSGRDAPSPYGNRSTVWEVVS